MTISFILGLIVWICVLGLCFGLALFALKQLTIPQPFKSIVIAILCFVSIIVLLAFATGQLGVPFFVVRH